MLIHLIKWVTGLWTDRSRIPQPPRDLREILTPENIQGYFSAKNYKFFNTPARPLNLNIVGVRRDNVGTDTFDDFLLLFYHRNSQLVSHCYPITTDPGKYWLENPMNPKGTAILVPGQYRGSWKLGKHQNNYQALVQCKPVKVWRDNNKDEVLDYNNLSLLVDEGYFGINIHRSNPYNESYVVNKWSAGCQVFKRVGDFEEFMSVCRSSAVLYGSTFTYTLIEEKDLRKHLHS